MAKLSEFEFKQENNNKFQEKLLRDKYDEFKGMNKEELNSKLFEEVSRQKQNGTFDFQSLSNMVESLRGSLPEGDYNNLKRILESLR